jgi:hypothetical protein
MAPAIPDPKFLHSNEDHETSISDLMPYLS